MRIVLTGGGTGGHFFPMVAVARELNKVFKNSDQEGLQMLFVGPPTFGDEILDKEGIPKKIILAGKLRRYFSINNLIDAPKVIIGFFQSLIILFSYMPNVIFSKGGYGSLPVILAAWLYRIPVLIHESDTTPGLANKIAAKFCRRIAVSFASASVYFSAKKTAILGNPIRPEILNGSIDEAKKIFKLSGTKPVILVLGGSQGAQAINDIVLLALFDLLEKCEIIHQCGRDNFDQLVRDLKNNLPPSYFLSPFLDEEQMRHALAAADLVIARGGAGTIFEIAACGKPSIIIPLPSASADHQNKNAYDYARTGATLVLAQGNLTPHFLVDRVFNLLQNPELLAKMSTAAKSFARLDAAQKIAEEILNIAKR